jgi:hypothetical protein
LFVVTVAFLGPLMSLNAAYAGAKHQHNLDVKAQCMADADSKGLTGTAYKMEVRKCRQNGSFTSSTSESRRTATALRRTLKGTPAKQ